MRNKKRCVFLDRDGVINHEVGFVTSIDEFIIYDFVPEAVKKINEAGFLCIVITNQSAIARNLITEKRLNAIHKHLKNHIFEKNGILIDDFFYCPHHPDFTGNCDCRKPKPGMLLNAAEKHNIDLSQSFLVGDFQRDIEAGKNAGCTTIGVRTGKGLENSQIEPNYMCDNILAAVDLILSLH